jgi:hypothetical protein
MRYLAARNPKHSHPITLVPMRSKLDCLTCVIAMLLGIGYEEVEQAFGGNINPAKGKDEESARLYAGFRMLLMKHHRGMIELDVMPPIIEGRRYWVGIQIDDPSNPLSQIMGHSIAVDEFGKVFDPNPQYREFRSLKEWHAAMTLQHRLDHATEIFEFTL